MIRFTLQDLDNKAKERPQGYREEILNRARKIDDFTYELSFEDFEELSRKYRLPSLIEMIKNIGEAAEQAIRDGRNTRTKQEAETCMETCASCPYLIISEKRCGVCGCYLKLKVLMKAWHCPRGKW